MLVLAIAVTVLVIALSSDSGESPSPAPKSKAAARGCSLDTPDASIEITVPRCTIVASDSAAEEDPRPFWGEIDCAEDSRHEVIDADGDQRPRADGAPQGDQSFRRMTVLDGDDEHGERCELGENDHEDGPTAFYREGERRVTFFSVRLPSELSLDGDTFQVVMQMKQAQPADNGGGTPVLALEAYDGEWRLRQSKSVGPAEDARQLWSAPAQTGAWIRFALDVTYSTNPSVGRVKLYADLDGDSDFADADEQNAPIETYTLKSETAGDDDDGIDEGEPIPSHLRAGLYHNPEYACPGPDGCHVDFDNVQVIAP